MFNQPYTVIRYEEEDVFLYAIIELIDGSRFRVLIRDENGMKW